jgi:hypothetical protein
MRAEMRLTCFALSSVDNVKGSSPVRSKKSRNPIAHESASGVLTMADTRLTCCSGGIKDGTATCTAKCRLHICNRLTDVALTQSRIAQNTLQNARSQRRRPEPQ